MTFKIIEDGAVWEATEHEELLKANGNPADAFTFRLIEGNFYEGETVTVQTIMDGKQYTRKVKSDSWDLYIIINKSKCYWESDRAE